MQFGVAGCTAPRERVTPRLDGRCAVAAAPRPVLRPGRPAGCIHPFVCPRRAVCRGWHGAGSRLAGRGQSEGRPRRWAGGGGRPARGRIDGALAPGPRARARSHGLSRRGDTADALVAHAVEDQGEQLAGGGDLGDLLGFLAAAGGDAVLDLPRLCSAPAIGQRHARTGQAGVLASKSCPATRWQARSPWWKSWSRTATRQRAPRSEGAGRRVSDSVAVRGPLGISSSLWLTAGVAMGTR
jgi:hypothetical protein